MDGCDHLFEPLSNHFDPKPIYSVPRVMFRDIKVLDEIFVSFAPSTFPLVDQDPLGKNPCGFQYLHKEKTIFKTSSPRSGKNFAIVSFL